MNESLFINESDGGSPEITDKQVIEALRGRGSNPEADEIFMKWSLNNQKKLDLIYKKEGSEKLAIASVDSTISETIVYYKAGYKEEAMALLEEACDAAQSSIFEKTGLLEKASDLLKKMKEGQTL